MATPESTPERIARDAADQLATALEEIGFDVGRARKLAIAGRDHADAHPVLPAATAEVVILVGRGHDVADPQALQAGREVVA